MKALATLAIALMLTGCTAEKPSPTVTSSPTGASEKAGEMFKHEAAKVDFCTATNLAPLADLGLTIKRKDKVPPISGPGEACLFEATTPSGHTASVRVEAVVLAGVDQAKLMYQAQRQTTRMRIDESVAGLGDEAEGLTLETEKTFKYSEYRVHARSGNLVIEVWLAVGGNQFTPRASMAMKSQILAQQTMATATGAWKA